MIKTVYTDAIAVIRETECIGCTKCIPVCPTDAIIGSQKLMHTVMSDACTGCGLCLSACPVDCISLLATENIDRDTANSRIIRLQEREKKREARLLRNTQEPLYPELTPSITLRRILIADSVARVQEKLKKRNQDECSKT